MRYRRGFIALSDDRDIPMLLTIRNAPRHYLRPNLRAIAQQWTRDLPAFSALAARQIGAEQPRSERVDFGRLLPEPVFGNYALWT